MIPDKLVTAAADQVCHHRRVPGNIGNFGPCQLCIERSRTALAGAFAALPGCGAEVRQATGWPFRDTDLAALARMGEP